LSSNGEPLKFCGEKAFSEYGNIYVGSCVVEKAWRLCKEFRLSLIEITEQTTVARLVDWCGGRCKTHLQSYKQYCNFSVSNIATAMYSNYKFVGVILMENTQKRKSEICKSFILLFPLCSVDNCMYLNKTNSVRPFSNLLYSF
jgi:hypothetical protein